MHDSRYSDTGKPRPSRLEVYWTTVTYRSVVIYGSLLMAIALSAWWVLHPESFFGAARWAMNIFAGQDESVSVTPQSRARFVAFDGRVQVRKVDSVQWVNADSRMTLEKGDLIQTGADSLARISFPDGTVYTVKAETLIAVEENFMSQNAPSRVGVHISSGAVDLSTTSWEVPGSKAEVSFENAVATLRENSRAAVRSDPQQRKHEITVTSGGAEMQRDGQSFQIAPYEKVSFPTNGEATRSRVLAPPQLAQPVNLQALVVPDPRRASINFEWKAVAGAEGYRLRVSTSSMFTQVVTEKRVSSNATSVTGLDAGDYFWAVTAVDNENRIGEPSDTYKFTLAAQGKGQEMLLEVEGTRVHGSVVEIFGRTEPGAVIIIYGQAVANIQADGRFRHFTPPLAKGSHSIVVSGQNRRGGFASQKVDVVVQ